MLLNRGTTPLPPVRNAPLQVAAPVWFDLEANGRIDVFDVDVPASTIVDLEALSGTNAADIMLEASTVTRTQSGTQTQTRRYPTAAQGGYDKPVRGPTASDQLSVVARNQGSAVYDAGNAGVFRTYLNYSLRPISLIDKLYMRLPVTQPESQIAEEFGLGQYTDLNLSPRRSPHYQSDLAGKSLITDATALDVVDVPAGGSTTVFDQRVPDDRVLYVTGVSVNGDAYTSADDVRLTFTREGPETFYEMDAYAAPAAPETVPLHVPFLSDATIAVEAAQAVSDVEVRIEYAWARRTLVELALYGLEEQVRANDRLADTRLAVYEDLQRFLTAGIPIEANYGAILSRAGVSRETAQSAATSAVGGR